MTIAILDDEPDRVREMREVLTRTTSRRSIVDFDNAPEMIAWLGQHLSECVLLCLDHDLGPQRRQGGLPFDPGIGRDVADYLATRVPTCPVLIHTTNSLAAPGMESVLTEAGWACARVVPYGDLSWIAEIWSDRVRELLA